jgi:hypothetical protein
MTNEERKALQDATNALYGILNIEGPAKEGGREWFPGLDVPIHFERVRQAIKACEAVGFTFE